MTPSLPPPRDRRPDIQGLRGLAVLLVVSFHAGLSWFRGAFVAVDVFFVLSGFFLTCLLMRQLVGGDGIKLASVQARRVWRLLPPLTLVLLATLASSMLLYAPIDRAAVTDLMPPVVLFGSNLAFAAEGVNYFHAGENPFLHTWTLGVEYQLALVFPLLVVGLAAIGRRRAEHAANTVARYEIILQTVLFGVIALGAFSLGLSVRTSAAAPMWAYFGPHTRLWTFCAGAATALVASEGQSTLGASQRRVGFAQAAGLGLILLPAIFFDRSMAYPGWGAALPVTGAVLLLAGGTMASQTLVGGLLSARPLTWLGGISFHWYLWHWPLMVLGAVLVPGIGPWGRLAWGLSGLLMAILTHRLVEGPVTGRVLPRVMSTRPLLWAALVCVTLVLVSQWASARSRSYVQGSVHRTFAAARGDRMDHGCWGNSPDEVRDGCGFGDLGSTTTLALLGDSHAEHWLGGLEVAGRENGWRIEAHVMGGCPVADFSELIEGASARRYRGCSRYREAMLSRIIAQRPRAAILSSWDRYIETADGEKSDYQVPEAVWIEGLRRTYTRLTAAGIPVLVIRGTPLVPFDVPSCQSRRAAGLLFATDCTYVVDEDFAARGRRAQDVAARGLDVTFVDMNDLVCADPCTTMSGGIVMFTDNNHLTASFARSLGSRLGERLAQALGGRSTE